MYKRMAIRLVSDLFEELKKISIKRGLSLNALISEMAWDFVEDWKKSYEERLRQPEMQKEETYGFTYED